MRENHCLLAGSQPKADSGAPINRLRWHAAHRACGQLGYARFSGPARALIGDGFQFSHNAVESFLTQNLCLVLSNDSRHGEAEKR